MGVTGTFPSVRLVAPSSAPDDVEAVVEALRSGWLTLGPRTQAFEEAFATHLGVDHAVAVASRTAGLHLAFLAAGVGAGDEVIVPALTVAATAHAVVHCGARPVFADLVGAHDLALDPDDVAARIGHRTKAVCAVHTAGYPAAAGRLRELCDANGLAFIEDAADAPSAWLGERRLGTWGLAGAFSFSDHLLLGGSGGLLATDDDDVAALARRLRSQGMTSGSWSRYTKQSSTYDALGLGFNYRLDEPRAALLLSRLRRLEADVAHRRELTRRYRARLNALDGIIVPYTDEAVEDSSCAVMPVLLPDSSRRDEVRRVLLQRHGVESAPFAPPVYALTVYRKRFPSEALPHTEAVFRRALMIPLHEQLDTAAQDRVIAALEDALTADDHRARFPSCSHDIEAPSSE